MQVKPKKEGSLSYFFPAKALVNPGFLWYNTLKIHDRGCTKVFVRFVLCLSGGAMCALRQVHEDMPRRLFMPVQMHGWQGRYRGLISSVIVGVGCFMPARLMTGV